MMRLRPFLEPILSKRCFQVGQQQQVFLSRLEQWLKGDKGPAFPCLIAGKALQVIQIWIGDVSMGWDVNALSAQEAIQLYQKSIERCLENGIVPPIYLFNCWILAETYQSNCHQENAFAVKIKSLSRDYQEKTV